MSAKVSVVIPVFNPGPYIEPCIDSLLTQTMSPDDLEIIFVDDASSDDSYARLERLATEHPHVQAITIERSGWPGKPRNVGTDAATGEYVMYVDQDDRLDPEALQRMYELGSANDADIVLGKVTSDFRGVHQYLYREQRPRCTVYDSRLINSQTPHKMLRRQFMVDNDLRYPEGRRRLEDQLFITRAYFAARSCSIIADYVCYRYLRRPDGGNAGSWRIDPAQYFTNLREVLDAIDTAVDPGPVRDHFYRRFLRVEMLGKLSGRRALAYPTEIGNTWLEQIRTLLEERFPLTVDENLPGLARTRAHLARHATFTELQELTERTRHVQPEIHLTAVEGVGEGSIQLHLDGQYEVEGEPLLLESDGAGGWLLPSALIGDLEPDLRRVEDLAEMTADLVVVDRERGDEWFLPPTLTVSIDPDGSAGRVRVTGVARLDPARAAGGRPLNPGTHDVLLRIEALGLSRLRRVTGLRSPAAPAIDAVVDRQPRSLLKTTSSGRTTVAVDVPAKAVRRQLSPVTAVWTDDRLEVHLSAAWWATGRLRATLTDRTGTGHDIRLRAADGTATRWVSSSQDLRPGAYQVRLHVKGSGSIPLETPLVVPRTARAMLRGARRRARSVLGSLARRTNLRS